MKGPGLWRVSTKPAALTAVTRVLKAGLLTAMSTMVGMVLVGCGVDGVAELTG